MLYTISISIQQDPSKGGLIIQVDLTKEHKKHKPELQFRALFFSRKGRITLYNSQNNRLFKENGEHWNKSNFTDVARRLLCFYFSTQEYAHTEWTEAWVIPKESSNSCMIRKMYGCGTSFIKLLMKHYGNNLN
jgi:hypothetical protein